MESSCSASRTSPEPGRRLRDDRRPRPPAGWTDGEADGPFEAHAHGVVGGLDPSDADVTSRDVPTDETTCLSIVEHHLPLAVEVVEAQPVGGGQGSPVRDVVELLLLQEGGGRVDHHDGQQTDEQQEADRHDRDLATLVMPHGRPLLKLPNGSVCVPSTRTPPSCEPKRNPKFEWETSFIQSGITGNAGMIGLLVATLDSGNGQGFHVSARSIARWTGLNEKTARIQLARLVESGWLHRTSTGGRRGNRVFASTYQLAIPDGSYRPKFSSHQDDQDAQPDRNVPQPEHQAPQPDAAPRPLDQVSLDQVSLDQVDTASLQPGDHITADKRLRLPPSEREMFVPGFYDNDVWIYEPEIMARVSEAARTASLSSPAPTRGQKRRLIENNRQEGFDENGQRLDRPSAPLRYGSRR